MSTNVSSYEFSVAYASLLRLNELLSSAIIDVERKFPVALREWRASKHLSQDAASELLGGIDRTYLSRLERGEKVSPKWMGRFSELLALTAR